jgi:hypothetical protein
VAIRFTTRDYEALQPSEMSSVDVVVLTDEGEKSMAHQTDDADIVQNEQSNPDPGRESGAPPPLSPEEYARLQKEARETDDK